MKSLNIFSILFIGLITISGTGCNDSQKKACILPSSFDNYTQAEELILNQDYDVSEFMSTPESSFVRDASFYSCDGNTGALQIGLNDNLYIYSGVPEFVWDNFKNADSKGSFYSTKIRGHYMNVKL